MKFEDEDRILIIGGSGQVGTELCKLFPKAICSTHHVGGTLQLDLSDSLNLEKKIYEINPNWIVNAAAITNVDLCETDKESAYQVNAIALKHIVNSARKLEIGIIHVSTDYVFDGKRGEYEEDDLPNPINFYGLSKLIGDTFVQSYTRALIVRTSGVYGIKSNFPYYVFHQLLKNQSIHVLEGYYSPIHARNLAFAIKELLKKGMTGTLNVAGDRISRYELAQKICTEFKLDKRLLNSIHELASLKAKRPYDSSLDITKAKSLLQFDFHSADSNLKYFRESMRQNGVRE